MRNLPLHPFFFALFYIVFPMAFNASNELISPYEVFWPVVWAVGVIGLALVLGRWALGCWRKSGLVTFVLVLQFFSYRGVYSALENAGWFPRILVQHWFVVTLWVGMLVGVAWVIRRPELGLHTVTLGLNLVTAGLFGIQVVSVAWPFLTATELASDPSVEEMAGGGGG